MNSSFSILLPHYVRKDWISDNKKTGRGAARDFWQNNGLGSAFAIRALAVLFNAINGTDFHAMGSLILIFTLIAGCRIDDINIVPLGDRLCRAFRQTQAAIRAIFQDYHRHFCLPPLFAVMFLAVFQPDLYIIHLRQKASKTSLLISPLA